MITSGLILIGKIISKISNTFNLGSGSTWPGHIALNVNRNFIKDLLKNSRVKIILIAGTNGKTTTGKLIQTILEKDEKKVFQNQAGANLLNGIASSLISNSNLSGKINKDFAIFEIDENTLPLILKEINNPDFVIILNLFRDQLDRYGEVNTIASKWKKSIEQLSNEAILILNADDPQVAYLGNNRSRKITHYFGLDVKSIKQKTPQHASDSLYCPQCDTKLEFKQAYYSHLGDWICPKCNLKRPELCESVPPKSSLVGIYNKYNLLAALTLAKLINVNNKTIEQSFRQFKPAFGRQEILNVKGKKVQIFLSKNPTSFNESLRTIRSLNAKNLLIVLNDRIPDGLDVSWIWDVDFEDFKYSFKNIVISGERTYDLALRIKYAQSIVDDSLFTIQEDLGKAISLSLEKTPKSETLYILPTYSAMLETRKVLTGRKIL